RGHGRATKRARGFKLRGSRAKLSSRGRVFGLSRLDMKTVFAIPLLLLAALVPTAAAASSVSLCTLIPDACIPPSYFVNGCHVNALVVRIDLPIDGCAPQVYVCTFEYFGGSGSFLGNFVWHCDPVLG